MGRKVGESNGGKLWGAPFDCEPCEDLVSGGTGVVIRGFLRGWGDSLRSVDDLEALESACGL